MKIIKAARLQPNAILPTRKHAEDAGMDFYAINEVTIPSLGNAIVPTGITIDIETGYVGLLKPKSRNNHILGAGVVDAGYQGEILIKIFNPSDHELVILKGEAIGQLVIIPIVTPTIQEVEVDEIHTSESERANNGGILSQFNR